MPQVLACNGLIPPLGETLDHRQHFISFISRSARTGRRGRNVRKRIRAVGYTVAFHQTFVSRSFFGCFSGTPMSPVAYQWLSRAFIFWVIQLYRAAISAFVARP